MKLLPNVCTVGSSKTGLSLALRWASIGWGIITIIWLPFEDTTTIFLQLLSLGWCAWFAGWVTCKFAPRSKTVVLILIGGLSGLLIFPVALTLTILKAGLHGHGFLDFSTSQLTGIARSTPIWVIIGLLVSAAFQSRRLGPSSKID
jgi:hypothetical protein